MRAASPDTPESPPVSGVSGNVPNFKAASLRRAKTVDSKWCRDGIEPPHNRYPTLAPLTRTQILGSESRQQLGLNLGLNL
jgi:hypothetical protein